MSIFIRESGEPTPEEAERQRNLEHNIVQAAGQIGAYFGMPAGDVLAATISAAAQMFAAICDPTEREHTVPRLSGAFATEMNSWIDWRLKAEAAQKHPLFNTEPAGRA